MLGFPNVAAAIQNAEFSSHDNVSATTTRTKARKALVRPVADASIVFAVLCLIGLTFGPAASSASPNIPNINGYQTSILSPASKTLGDRSARTVVEIAATRSAADPNAIYRQTSTQAAWGLLMIALSIVAAVNMAFLRHMRQAYTPPRRSAKNSSP